MSSRSLSSNYRIEMEGREEKGGDGEERRGEGKARHTMKEPKPCGKTLSASHRRHCNMCNT
jgi:hypothetical protein